MREDIKEKVTLISDKKVPDGYVRYKTEIVPKDFTIITLDELVLFQNGINAEKEKFGNGTKIISVSDILKEQPIYYDTIKGEIDVTEEQLENYSVTYGDILFQRSSENLEDAGKANVYLDKGNIATFGGFVIRGKKKKDYNPVVINEILKLRYVRKQNMRFAAGAQHINIGQESLKKIWIALPDERTQTCVERLVSHYAAQSSIFERLIKNKKQKKEWLKQNLLTGKKRLPEFKAEWQCVKLSLVLTERKEYSERDKGYEHVTLAKEGILPKSNRYDREHLVKEDDKEYKVTYFNDICYNPANLKFGVICRNVYGNAIFSPIYVTFEVNEGYDVEFISQFVTRWDFINAVRKYEEGTVYERMSVKSEDFLRFEVNLPEIREQEAIAKVLSTADKEIELLQKKLELIKQEKKAMMQLLLTGIVRVN